MSYVRCGFHAELGPGRVMFAIGSERVAPTRVQTGCVPVFGVRVCAEFCAQI